MLVTRLDRLARSTRDLLNIGEAKASFRPLHLGLGRHYHAARSADPAGARRVGGFERHLVAARSEGRKRAAARGVLFGRPRKLTPHQCREALALSERGTTLMEIARSYAASHISTL
jgi:DNA invertase Pin-like site-specific DNA recombinase